MSAPHSTTYSTTHSTTDTDRITEIQELTVQWAAKVLEEPDVTPQDNFLDLGGHSILALRMSRYAKDRLGVDYDLMVLFEADLATAARDLAARADAG